LSFLPDAWNTGWLAQKWVAGKPAFENQFFQYRIPTADPEKP
jgi:hypothetical protein